MNKEFLQVRELAELEQFKFYANKIGLQSSVFPTTKTNPVNMLIIGLDNTINLNILFVPVPFDQFSQISLLQVYALLQEKINDADPKLYLLLNHINEKNPLGQFFINDEGELTYKHIFAKVKTEFLSEDFFVELLAIIVPCVTTHAQILKEYIGGNIIFDEALNSLN
jgi:hypothetical protein